MQLIVSPHLDDAVLSCGALIAGGSDIHVVTVFAGRPQRADVVGATEWDRLCGFTTDDDVVGIRRAEDEAACALLGASPVWLEFVDDQYSEMSSVEAIVDALDAVIARIDPREIYMPLGLFHRDHDRTHQACRKLTTTDGRAVFAYADAPYRALDGLVDDRIAELDAAGVHPRRVDVDLGAEVDVARKREAIACYGSQVRALEQAWPGFERVLTREHYWRLGP